MRIIGSFLIALSLISSSAMAAFIPNALTSSGSKYRVESATIAESANCTASPCTITRQSGSWLSSVTRTGAGLYTINFTAGTFTSAPSCMAMFSNAGWIILDSAATTSAFSLDVRNTSNARQDASNINIICMGAR